MRHRIVRLSRHDGPHLRRVRERCNERPASWHYSVFGRECRIIICANEPGASQQASEPDMEKIKTKISMHSYNDCINMTGLKIFV
jgi:hypothetical protein